MKGGFMFKRLKFVSLLIAILLLLQASGFAEAAYSPSTSEELGYGVLAGFGTLVWFPLKLSYAVLGLTVGGLGYAISGGNADVAKYVIIPSCKGTYVISPKLFYGEESFVPMGE